jgi:hypothetical protein
MYALSPLSLTLLPSPLSLLPFSPSPLLPFSPSPLLPFSPSSLLPFLSLLLFAHFALPPITFSLIM